MDEPVVVVIVTERLLAGVILSWLLVRPCSFSVSAASIVRLPCGKLKVSDSPAPKAVLD